MSYEALDPDSYNRARIQGMKVMKVVTLAQVFARQSLPRFYLQFTRPGGGYLKVYVLPERDHIAATLTAFTPTEHGGFPADCFMVAPDMNGYTPLPIVYDWLMGKYPTGVSVC